MCIYVYLCVFILSIIYINCILSMFLGNVVGLRYDRYMVIDQLGVGSQGRVYKAKDINTDEICALKTIKKPSSLEFLSTEAKHKRTLCMDLEIQALYTLKHPNIIKLLDIMQSVDEVILVTQFCENDLFSIQEQKKPSFTEQEVRLLALDIISVLEYITSQGWIHRDVKIENILYHQGKYILCDWGYARKFSYDKLIFDESFGSLYYASPEIIKNCGYIGPECDIWSLGVVLYSLLAVSTRIRFIFNTCIEKIPI